jgi:Glyoxalase-like domain
VGAGVSRLTFLSQHSVGGMHRSRIGIVLIDHAERHDAALAFWSGVTGVTPVREEDAPYSAIGPIGSLNLAVQRLGEGSPARIHLDIESDNPSAEIDRLIGLGAIAVERKENFAIMKDPGGLVFCVVPVQTGERFEREATTWD